ncbi:hypothetical protein ACYSNR_17320 [Enterococcus sp. LJL128]
MIKSTKTVQEILEDILSKDPQKVWAASCAIISLGQDEEVINKLLPFLDKIKKGTRGVALGGYLAPNQRFVDKAIKTISFYQENKSCSCCLFDEMSNPVDEQKNSNVFLLETVAYPDSSYVDYYRVQCKKCNAGYQVFERQSHFPWWEWILLT